MDCRMPLVFSECLPRTRLCGLLPGTHTYDLYAVLFFYFWEQNCLGSSFATLLQSCLAPELVEAKVSTFSALVSNTGRCSGPCFLWTFNYGRLNYQSLKTEILGTTLPTEANRGVRFSSLGLLPAWRAFAPGQELSCSADWSNVLFQCYTD